MYVNSSVVFFTMYICSNYGGAQVSEIFTIIKTFQPPDMDSFQRGGHNN